MTGRVTTPGLPLALKDPAGFLRRETVLSGVGLGSLFPQLTRQLHALSRGHAQLLRDLVAAELIGHAVHEWKYTADGPAEPLSARPSVTPLMGGANQGMFVTTGT